MYRLSSDIPNQVNIAEDILIGSTVAKHDVALNCVLSKLAEDGVTLKVPKSVFEQEKITIVGLVFSKGGICPDPRNVTYS